LSVIAGPGFLLEQPAPSPVLSDFYAAVSVQLGAGDDTGQLVYGLAYRLSGQDRGFFGLQKSGGYWVQELQAGATHNGEYESSPLIEMRPGASNRLAVLAQGQTVSLLVNDQRVAHYITQLGPGAVGLGVAALSSAPAAQVDFTNFEVRSP
jgi:hypothetical protein